MTADTTPKAPGSGPTSADWKDYLHTLNLSFALLEQQALRRQEAAALADANATRFTFTLLAAATSTDLQMPDEEVLDRDETMSLRVDRREGRLHVWLQAQNEEALDMVSGRWATLSSVDGIIRSGLRFDDNGRAEAILPDERAVVSALAAIEVTVPSTRFQFDGDGDETGPA